MSGADGAGVTTMNEWSIWIQLAMVAMGCGYNMMGRHTTGAIWVVGSILYGRMM